MKNRRLGTIIMICLIAVLCGLGTYIVYASVNITFRATNRIVFNADPTKIFYTATVTVKYENETEPIISDTINHGGTYGKQDLAKTQITFNDAISFTNEHQTIIYEIVIENHTEQAIKVNVNKHADTQYFTNTINQNDKTLSKFKNGLDAPTTTFVITSTMLTNEFSFVYDNSFSIDFELA